MQHTVAMSLSTSPKIPGGWGMSKSKLHSPSDDVFASRVLKSEGAAHISSLMGTKPEQIKYKKVSILQYVPVVPP